MRLTPLLAFAALLAGTVLAIPSVRADTLSWGNSAYAYDPSQAGANPTPGTVGIVNAGTARANTVKIEYGNASYFNNNNAGEPSPSVGTYDATNSPIFTNGGTTGVSAFQLLVNFSNSATGGGTLIAGASVPVTILFSKPVTGLTFTFYDVDGNTGANAFNDYITNISGTSLMNTTVVPMTLTPSSAYNTASPTTTPITTPGSFAGGNTNSPQNANTANATVAFGNTPITQFTFTYTDTGASGTNTHSNQQIIGLSDLSFTTVPEPSTWTLLGAAGFAGFWSLRRRTRRTA